MSWANCVRAKMSAKSSSVVCFVARFIVTVAVILLAVGRSSAQVGSAPPPAFEPPPKISPGPSSSMMPPPLESDSSSPFTTPPGGSGSPVGPPPRDDIPPFDGPPPGPTRTYIPPVYAPPPSVPLLVPFEPIGPTRFWFQSDYLLWWTKNAPLPAPLVTSGSASDAVPGALGQPGTQVIYGGQSVDLGAANGWRLDTGVWLDHEQRFGLEAGFFILERQGS